MGLCAKGGLWEGALRGIFHVLFAALTVNSTFFKAKVKNLSDYTLLPGKANVYVNESFIAQSKVPAVSPQESFRCPLG